MSLAKASQDKSLSTPDVYLEVCTLVHRIAGIQLGEKQKSMVTGRLNKRIRDLGLHNETEYLHYLKKHEKTEIQALVSLLTTHHTYFFREFSHFEYFGSTLLPQLITQAKERKSKTIRIWSAACSRGQEAYSLAMFLDFHLPKLAPDFDFEILATDVDAESVAYGRNGVYSRNEIKEVPQHFLAQHWVRGTGAISDFVKVRDSLKKKVRFEVANLTQLATPRGGIGTSIVKQTSFDLSTMGDFDAIFCRNVFIYFSPDQIRTITQKLSLYLSTHGHLFIGLSESLHGLGLALNPVGPSIYAHQKRPSTSTPSTHVSVTLAPATSLRVLCVDDSPSILTLLKKILSKDQGFEIVATATNGIEAKKALQSHQVDVITLDLHMPEQGGLEYLKNNFGPTHPPVVVISSVPREDAHLALAALDAGASDYVEKPSLAELVERSEEIRMKLSCAVQLSKLKTAPPSHQLDQAFAKTFEISHPERLLHIVLARLGDRTRLQQFIRELKGQQPPLWIVIEGGQGALPALVTELKKANRPVQLLDSFSQGSIRPNEIVVSDFKLLKGSPLPFPPTLITCLGHPSRKTAEALLALSPRSLLLEEIPPHATTADSTQLLRSRSTAVMPFTSLAYTAHEFLSKAGSK